MMVYFRERLPESVINDCNERIVHHGLSAIRSSAANDHDDDKNSHGRGTARADDQQIGSDKAQPNQGSSLVDAKCILADIRHLTDLSLHNKIQGLTEKLIDSMDSRSQIPLAITH
jgi:IS5 family transposase